jgi:hypothetical protein
MDATEAEKIAKEIRDYRKQLAKEPPEKSKEMLIAAGICTKSGKLTKAYR